jgi:hypothetical protein
MPAPSCLLGFSFGYSALTFPLLAARFALPPLKYVFA